MQTQPTLTKEEIQEQIRFLEAQKTIAEINFSRIVKQNNINIARIEQSLTELQSQLIALGN